MEAKDTVMAGTQLHELWLGLNMATQDVYKIAQAQAEITGKIMKQEGIKEVAEWIRANSETFETHSGRIVEFNLRKEEWQAKLKEWGIS